MKNIEFIIGTRPELTKSIQIIQSLITDYEIKTKLFFTGQQIELVKMAFKDLKIDEKCDVTWLIPPNTQKIYYPEWANSSKNTLKKRWKKEQPDAIVIVGDTSSVLLSAKVAHEMGILIIHLEGGIRLRMNIDDVPEEKNRKIISHLATYHLVPTVNEEKNLIKEGIAKEKITIVGDLSASVVSWVYNQFPKKIKTAKTLEESINLISNSDIVPLIKIQRGYILCTFHRQSSLINQKLLQDWISILNKQIGNTKIIICTRPDTRWIDFYNVLSSQGVICIDSLPPLIFQILLKYSNCIITDSAGVQQEALLLRKNVITHRSEVELYEDSPRLTLVPPPYGKPTKEHVTICTNKRSWIKPKKEWKKIGRNINMVLMKIINKLKKV